MINTVKNIKRNKPLIIMLAILAAMFAYINFVRFNKLASVNNKHLVNYKQNIDELYNYREPKIAVLLFDNSKLDTIVVPSKNYLPYIFNKHGKAKEVLIKDPVTNINEIYAIIKEKNLLPKTIELNSKNLDSFVAIYDPENHKANIMNFINDNKTTIKNVIDKSKEAKEAPFNVSKKDYPSCLFDKANSFVYFDGTDVGSLNSKVGIGQDIANNIFIAKTKGINMELAKIVILTKIKPIEYTSQDDLYKQINAGSDGLVIRDGYRQAVMLPYMWNKYKSKEDFIAQLKLKAKLLPNYKSNNIKFYKFEVVEI